MIRILALLAFLASPAYAADVSIICYNPPGSTANSSQPCQISNAAAVAAQVRGSGNSTGTGATTIIGSQGAGITMRISSAQCARTDAGTTAVFVTFNDSASTVMVVPNTGGGGGNNMVFQIPLLVAANTAFTFTDSSGITTMYCNAQGFKDTQ